MDQAEFELQLKVWKDLAISKQILMRTASDALGLDPDCSADELKVALDAAIKKSINAEANIAEAQEKSEQAISVMEKKVADVDKSMAIAEDEKSQALEALQKFEQQMAGERTAHATELKKAKAQALEKDKALKAVNKALADTPENVVKKLKALKKQKTEEAAARKQATTEVASLKKEKRSLEQRVADMEAALEESAKLAEQYRELHKQATEQHEQLKPLVEDAEALAAVPELDEGVLEKITQAAGSEEKK